MSKEFFCQLCNGVFTDEDMLVHHIKQRHVTTFENKSMGLSAVYNALTEAFPDAKIRIDEGSGYYAQYRIFVTLEGATYEQRLGHTKESDSYEYDRIGPNSIDDAVTQLHWKIALGKELIAGISAKGKFEKLELRGFTYGYSMDEHCFNITYRAPGQSSDYQTCYYPWGEIGQAQFIEDFKQYFVTVLEGEWSQRDDSGYFEGYSIDGVSIEGLLQRAKRVRLEIVEKK